MKNPIVFFVLGGAAVIATIMAVIIGFAIGQQTRAVSAQPVPVKITYRRSIVGNGYVFRITDTGTRELFCTATVRNSNVWKQYRLDLRPNDFREIGSLQGWEAFPGDTCEVEADRCSAITGTIP